jgi:hypothetical protein
MNLFIRSRELNFRMREKIQLVIGSQLLPEEKEIKAIFLVLYTGTNKEEEVGILFTVDLLIIIVLNKSEERENLY